MHPSPSADVATRPAGTIGFIHGLRGLLSVYVALFHLILNSSPPDHVGFRVLSYPLTLGHLAVACFLVLSGFLLSLPAYGDGVKRRSYSPWRFLWRRFLRIAPPFYAAFLLHLMVYGAYGWWVAPMLGIPLDPFIEARLAQGFEWESFALHFGLLSNWSNNWSSAVNGIFWTLSCEWQVYVLHGFVLLPLLMAGYIRWALVGALVPSVVLLYLVDRGLVQYLLPWMVLCFGLGMGVAHVCRANTAFAVRARRQNWGLLFLAAVAVVVLVDSVLKLGVYTDKGIYRLVPGMSYYLVPFHWRWLPDVLGGLAFGALVVWLMQCRDGEAGMDGGWAGVGGWLLRLLESRPISALGRMGYSVYLTHGFVVVMTWRMVAWLVRDPLWRFVASMSLGLVLTLLVGKAFHWAVERHFSPRD